MVWSSRIFHTTGDSLLVPEVLIHSAAGGVGLAAVHLCKKVLFRIFCYFVNSFTMFYMLNMVSWTHVRSLCFKGCFAF